MTTRRIDVDLDMQEGCRQARICAEDIKTILGGYRFKSQKRAAKDVADLFSDINNHVDDLLSEGMVGSISVAEEDDF